MLSKLFGVEPKIPTCPVCKVKPCFKKNDGSYYDTCGKSCSSIYNAPNCSVCKTKPCHKNPNGGFYPTCGLFCAEILRKEINNTQKPTKTDKMNKEKPNNFQFPKEEIKTKKDDNFDSKMIYSDLSFNSLSKTGS